MLPGFFALNSPLLPCFTFAAARDDAQAPLTTGLALEHVHDGMIVIGGALHLGFILLNDLAGHFDAVRGEDGVSPKPFRETVPARRDLCRRRQLHAPSHPRRRASAGSAAGLPGSVRTKPGPAWDARCCRSTHNPRSFPSNALRANRPGRNPSDSSPAP